MKEVQKRINDKMGQSPPPLPECSARKRRPVLLTRFAAVHAGVKELATGLAPPNLWDLAADKQRMGEEHPLQVARCTKIIRLDENAPPPALAPGQKPNADEQDKYVINVKQIAKFVVALGDRVAPTDIEEGMRVGSVLPLLVLTCNSSGERDSSVLTIHTSRPAVSTGPTTRS